MIRTLIIDDEPLAREGIRLRLEQESDVTIVGEAEDGPAAVEAIRLLAPDLVFLDVQMPGFDGFEVLDRIGGEKLPVVIFVTAHDAHALRAFEVHALDYLLKPYSEARFRESLRRARDELRREDDYPERDRLVRLLESLEAETTDRRHARRFAVRDRERILLVRADEIEAIEAAGNYVQLITPAGKHLLRQTLADMEAQLDPARFARIHRSTIVSSERVREIRPDPHGDGTVVMASGATYRFSRAYRQRLIPGGS